MKRRLSLLLCLSLLLGLCLFAAPAALAAAPQYASWREAYTAVLTDEQARTAAIGSAADYPRAILPPTRRRCRSPPMP